MFARGDIKAADGTTVVTLDSAIFSDTQGEPESVYAHLELLKREIQQEAHPFPIRVITAGNLAHDAAELRVSKKTGSTYIRGLIPAFIKKPNGKRGLLGRKCTAEYKVRAIIRDARRQVSVPRKVAAPLVTMYIGISLDEWHRMKPSREWWIANNYPLVDMLITRAGCEQWTSERGYRPSPRSACEYCPFHSDVEWSRLKQHEPKAFARAVEFDNRLRHNASQCTGTGKLRGEVYIHSSLVPLGDVVFDNSATVDTFGNDCTGLCGV